MLRKLFAWGLAAIGLHAASGQPARAQTNVVRTPDWGSWFIGTVQLPGGKKGWGAYAEVQARTNQLFRQYFYNELKGGVSYDLGRNFTVMLAGGRYATADYRALEDGPLSVEKRLWQQVTLSQYPSRLKIEHRYRVEQRWFTFRDNVTPSGSSRFRTRLRYRLNAFLPLNHKTIADNTVFLSVYDEVFVNPAVPTLERNRLYGGVGYQFSPHWTVQAGWVSQANYAGASFRQNTFTPQTNTYKNNLVLALTYRISRGNTNPATEGQLPSQQD